jgi:hypothetical protein
MAEADVIATAAVELVAEGQGIIDELRKVQDESENTLDGIKKAWESAFGEMGGMIGESLAGLSDIDFAERIAAAADSAGMSIQEIVRFLEDMNIVLGRSSDEAVALGESYRVNIEQGLTQAIQTASQEIQKTGEITPVTAAALRDLAAAAKNVGSNSEQMAAKIGVANHMLETVGKSALDAADKTKRNAEETKKGGVGMAAVDSILGKFGLSLGKISSGLAIVTLGWKAYNAVMSEVSESIDLAMKLSEVEFKLDVAARAAQRSLGDQAMTTKEARDWAAELSRAYGQSIVAMSQVIAKGIQMTLGMGYTEEQVKELTKAAVVLNETIGMDSVTALRTMSMFISTGQGARALTTQGFRLTLTAQKTEAYNMGIRKSWKELSEQEKQLVRTNLLMRQVAVFTEDAAAGQFNLAKMAAHANQQVEEQRVVLGKALAPLKVAWDTVLGEIEAKFLKIFAGVAGWIALFVVGSAAAFSTWYEIFENEILKPFNAVGQAIDKMIHGDLKGAQDALKEGWRDTGKSIGDYIDIMSVKVAAGMEFIKRSIEGLGNTLKTASEDAQEFAAQVDAALELVQSSIDEIMAEYTEARNKLEADYQKALDKIDAEMNKRLGKAWSDYNADIADINAQAAEARANAAREYQLEEQRDKEDHLRRMKELETQYLFDLQDAVRERDARQVLLLQRRYNMEKQKAEDDYRINRKRRLEDYQQELVDIDQQALKKRLRRYQEYLQEVSDIKAWAAERRAMLKEQFDADLAELGAKYAELLADIFQQMLAQGVDPAIVKAAAEKVGMAYGAYAGAAAGSKFSEIMSQVLQNAADAATNLINAINKSLPKGGKLGKTPYYASGEPKERGLYGGGFQTGGDFIATSPQTITVGERPERISIQPLNRATGEAAGNMGRGGGGGRGGGRVEVAVKLSEGLEGSIVDQAMAEVADVFVTIQRGDRAAPSGGGRR